MTSRIDWYKGRRRNGCNPVDETEKTENKELRNRSRRKASSRGFGPKDE